MGLEKSPVILKSREIQYIFIYQIKSIYYYNCAFNCKLLSDGHSAQLFALHIRQSLLSTPSQPVYVRSTLHTQVVLLKRRGSTSRLSLLSALDSIYLPPCVAPFTSANRCYQQGFQYIYPHLPQFLFDIRKGVDCSVRITPLNIPGFQEFIYIINRYKRPVTANNC